jgi:hypothetical protein
MKESAFLMHLLHIIFGYVECGSASLVRILRSSLKDKWQLWSRRLRLMAMGFRNHATPLYPQKSALKFTDKWQLLSRYSLLAD